MTVSCPVLQAKCLMWLLVFPAQPSRGQFTLMWHRHAASPGAAAPTPHSQRWYLRLVWEWGCGRVLEQTEVWGAALQPLAEQWESRSHQLPCSQSYMSLSRTKRHNKVFLSPNSEDWSLNREKNAAAKQDFSALKSLFIIEVCFKVTKPSWNPGSLKLVLFSVYNNPSR